MDIKNWLSEQTSAATSVFQVGRYCDSWKATGSSLNGASSFHLILDGECWLQLDGVKKRVHLVADDVVFFFRNQPFYFLSTPEGVPEAMDERVWQSTDTAAPGTSMLCGWLLARNDTTQLLFGLMPDYLILRAEEQANNRLRLLFELLNMECHVHLSPCDITVGKLTDLLLLYVMEQALSNHTLDLSIIRAARAPEMASLFLAILKSPGGEWSVERMAEKAGMSRSTFIRKVNTLCGGYTPNELLTRLRMSSALNILLQGKTAEVVAGMVGYDTPAGFTRAFTRIMGEGPGSWSHRLLAGHLH